MSQCVTVFWCKNYDPIYWSEHLTCFYFLICATSFNAFHNPSGYCKSYCAFRLYLGAIITSIIFPLSSTTSNLVLFLPLARRACAEPVLYVCSRLGKHKILRCHLQFLFPETKETFQWIVHPHPYTSKTFPMLADVIVLVLQRTEEQSQDVISWSDELYNPLLLSHIHLSYLIAM